MEGLAKAALPVGMGYEWTAMAFQEKRAGGQIAVIFGLAIGSGVDSCGTV